MIPRDTRAGCGHRWKRGLARASCSGMSMRSSRGRISWQRSNRRPAAELLRVELVLDLAPRPARGSDGRCDDDGTRRRLRDALHTSCNAARDGRPTRASRALRSGSSPTRTASGLQYGSRTGAPTRATSARVRSGSLSRTALSSRRYRAMTKSFKLTHRNRSGRSSRFRPPR